MSSSWLQPDYRAQVFGLMSGVDLPADHLLQQGVGGHVGDAEV